MGHPYDEFVEFIIADDPRRFIDFTMSEAGQRRVWELVHRKKEEGLTPAAEAELDTFVVPEHVMRMAKARSRLKPDSGYWSLDGEGAGAFEAGQWPLIISRPRASLVQPR